MRTVILSLSLILSACSSSPQSYSSSIYASPSYPEIPKSLAMPRRLGILEGLRGTSPGEINRRQMRELRARVSCAKYPRYIIDYITCVRVMSQ